MSEVDGMRNSVDRSRPLRSMSGTHALAWIDEYGSYHWGLLYLQSDGTVLFAREADDDAE